ncbi:histidinol-phosphate transaminase [Jonesia quinghaiensis]|uniref:histidinol-phosphate transaminase n=1 Tax=Jonesia quinghaiensis TaxID=262806 RepID=UPI00041DDAFB|nr:histidinol-phosphate transaminase [Jonesia quinghaiensis]
MTTSEPRGASTTPPDTIALPIRPGLRGETPYGAPQLDVPHLLNTNENPYEPPAIVVAEIADRVTAAATGLNRYPDREFTELRHALAHYLRHESHAEVDERNIWAANGSNEVMLHILQAFGGPGRTAMTFTPTYAMYSEYARDTLTDVVAIPRGDDFSIDLDAAHQAIKDIQPSVIFLTSPNNPTGTALRREEIASIAHAAADVDIDGAPAIVVVDEAYAEFRREGTPSAVQLLPQFPHLVVTRTMSKAFALAGARLGYMAAHPQLIDALRIVRLPYHLSAVTQAVACAALNHADLLQQQVAQLRDDRDALVDWLRSQTYHGRPLTVAQSDANFIFFGLFDDRDDLWRRLLQHGVLIRQSGPAGWLRVTVGTPQEIKAFTTALKKELEQ